MGKAQEEISGGAIDPARMCVDMLGPSRSVSGRNYSMAYGIQCAEV